LKTVRRILVGAVVAATMAVAFPVSAGAGGGGGPLQLVSPTEPLAFTATIQGFDCNPGSFVLVSLTLDGAPIEPLSVTEDPTDPNVATIVLPSDTPGGALLAIVGCTDGEVTIPPQTLTASFASLAVTKVVTGTVPDGATFVVNVDCVGGRGTSVESFDGVGATVVPESFDVDLEYGATGGLGYVYTDHGVDCTITEPEDAGAATVTIDPELVVIESPDPYEATVTNTFPDPIVVEPTFTG
jgi:hypothetical protein